MSPLVTATPAMARADRVGPADRAELAGRAGVRRMRVADSTPRPLLTKRRPVDFGLVTSCLCRCA